MNSRAMYVVTVLYSIIVGMGLMLAIMLFTGLGQDIPGTGGLTRVQLAEMLYECDRGNHEGYCVADVNVRPANVNNEGL